MWQTIEWTLKNESWSGNPFDLAAEVRFEHQSSGASINTGIYYIGDALWQFRFTGTLTGRWRYTTSSEDPELSGHAGSIIVHNNEDPGLKGFLTHRGNRFAIWVGNTPELKAYRFNVYMNMKAFDTFDSKLSQKPWSEAPLFQFSDPSVFNAYLDDALKNGFEIVFLHPGYPHVWTNGSNPRRETFHLLENAIKLAHAKGMRIHIWMWGDNERKATPIGFDPDGPNGINGEIDRRLQKYIAARLGPLPGWSMGYGFDLHEWVSPEQTQEWADFLHREFGWDHLLAARGISLNGFNNINSYDGFGRKVDLKTTPYGPKDFKEIAEDLEHDPNRPHLYAERHTYLRTNFKMDMDRTRRLLWHLALAGGMGGWFGFFGFSDYPYPESDQLRTVNAFWKNRFSFDLKHDPRFKEGVALRNENDGILIVYTEDTSRLGGGFFDGLSHRPLIAVDTKKEYREIQLKIENAPSPRIRFPYRSDWALLIEDSNH